MQDPLVSQDREEVSLSGALSVPEGLLPGIQHSYARVTRLEAC